MVPRTLPFLSDMFAFSRDQCSVTQELLLQHLRILLFISNTSLGPTVDSVSAEQLAAFRGCSLSRSYWQTTRSMWHASQPSHQWCKTLSFFLLVLPAAVCNCGLGKASTLVLKRQMQGAEQDRTKGLLPLASQDANQVLRGTHPVLKHCWFLTLEGLNLLLPSWESRSRGPHWVCTWEQRGKEGQNCFLQSRWDTFPKPKLWSPLWVTWMKGSGWIVFRLAVAAKDSLGQLYVCVHLTDKSLMDQWTCLQLLNPVFMLCL